MPKPLWAPWRLEYVQHADELGRCIFCDPEPELLVDQELRDGIGIEPVRSRPVGGHVPGLGQLAPGGLRVLVQPLPDLAPTGVVVAGEAEVHRGSVFSASRFTHIPGGDPG